MPEIRETMNCACTEFEQRTCSLNVEQIFLVSIYLYNIENFSPTQFEEWDLCVTLGRKFGKNNLKKLR